MSHIVPYELLGCVNKSSTPFSGSCSLTLWHLILAWTNLLWRLSCHISLLKSADLLCSGIVLFLDSWWPPVTLCKEVGRLLWGSFSYLSSTYLLLQPKGEILPTLLFNVLYYWHSQKVGKKNTYKNILSSCVGETFMCIFMCAKVYANVYFSISKPEKKNCNITLFSK